MNNAHLQIFSAVVETGSFTKAGKKLNITQSGISHAIASLEKELGVSLLIRERGKVSLTEIGERVLKHVKEIQYHLDSIRDETQSLSAVESGKIRIGSFPSALSRLLPRILASFQKKFPNVDIVLFEGTDSEILEWITDRVIDIGFTTLPQKDLETIPISKDRLLVVVPPDHKLIKKKHIRLQEIMQEPFILSKGGCEPIIRGIWEHNQVTPHIAFEVRDMSTILSMVQEGLGWTIVPEEALPIEGKQIRSVPLDPPTWRQIGLAMKSTDHLSHAVQAFINVAKELYTEK
jgi:DNA-binding transcriptional LysR family regulator